MPPLPPAAPPSNYNPAENRGLNNSTFGAPLAPPQQYNPTTGATLSTSQYDRANNDFLNSIAANGLSHFADDPATLNAIHAHLQSLTHQSALDPSTGAQSSIDPRLGTALGAVQSALSSWQTRANAASTQQLQTSGTLSGGLSDFYNTLYGPSANAGPSASTPVGYGPNGSPAAVPPPSPQPTSPSPAYGLPAPAPAAPNRATQPNPLAPSIGSAPSTSSAPRPAFSNSFAPPGSPSTQRAPGARPTAAPFSQWSFSR